MIKTFKNAISMFLVVVFVLSLVPVVSFAALPAYYADAAPYPWTGDNVPAARMINSAGTHAVNKTTHKAENKPTLSVLEYEEGCYGKVSSDAVYHTLDFSERTSISLNNNGDFTTTPSNNGKDLVLEFGFAYKKAGADNLLVQSQYRFFKDINRNSTNYGYSPNPLIIKTNGIAFDSKWNSNAVSKAVTPYTFEPNKWYNVTLVFDVENKATATDESEDNYTYKAYVNGELVASTTYNTVVYYGLSTMRTLPAFNADMYWDNINIYSIDNADTFVCSEVKEADIFSNNASLEIDSAAGRITVPKTTKVSDLKAAISTTAPSSVIRYYNSDYSRELSDSDSALGANIVIASSRNYGEVSRENTYTYYEVNKWMYRYPGINDGTTEITKDVSGKSAWFSMSSVSDNLGGKGDDYLLMADSSGVSRKIEITNASGNQDVFEMSFYVPSTSNGAKLTIRFTNLSDKSVELPLLIKADGLYTDWSSGPSKFHSLKPNRWHTFALVSPEPYINSDAQGSNTVNMYINGELVDSRAATKTSSGLRNKISISAINNDSNHAPVVYLDNIRVHSLGYAPQYDALDNISYKDGIGADNNIIVKGETTVAQLKADITKKDDTVIRVYESINSTEILSDDTYVKDGYVVVAAAMNDSEMERSYNYFTVDKVKRDFDVNTLVNGAAGKIYDDDDTISVSATYENYDDSDAKVVMYTAVYKYGELVKIYEDSQTVEPNKTGRFSCDFADLESRVGTNVKVMLWDNTSQAPYMATSTMHYNSENTKATLYLLGDSIVQTYVNLDYPIQGWGYYLADYLNDNITVENRATSGWTTDHYLYPDGIYTKENGLYPVGTELLNTKGNKKTVGTSNRYKTWESIKSTLKAGDYIMIALGINDSGSGNVPEARYRENIETIYTEATAMGASVILMTPSITGRDWNDTASFREDYAGRGNICKSIAASHGSVCLAYGAELIKTYNAMVEEYQAENPDATLVEAKNYVRNYFHLYGASSTNPPPGWDDFGSKTTDDDMHYNFVGAKKAASVIAKLLAESDSPLGDYVVK